MKPTWIPVDPAVMAEMQYHDISTGAARKGTMNTGGLYRRHMAESILDFVIVDDIDTVQANVEEMPSVSGNRKRSGVFQRRTGVLLLPQV
jgi:hypothetical protein